MNYVLRLLERVDKKVYWYLGWCLLILLVGFIMGFKCNTPDKPVVTNTTIIKVDSVIIHDTMPVYKPIIKYKEKIVIQYKKDTSNTLISMDDTSRCYTVEGTSERGTYVQTEVCSKEFPNILPIDITSNMIIRESPDTIKTLTIQDTIVYKTPWYKDKKNYIIVGLAATVVGLIALR